MGSWERPNQLKHFLEQVNNILLITIKFNDQSPQHSVDFIDIALIAARKVQ